VRIKGVLIDDADSQAHGMREADLLPPAQVEVPDGYVSVYLEYNFAKPIGRARVWYGKDEQEGGKIMFEAEIDTPQPLADILADMSPWAAPSLVPSGTAPYRMTIRGVSLVRYHINEGQPQWVLVNREASEF
jgi:hypothetical protein